MTDSDFIERFSRDVAGVKAAGRKTIRISAIETYLEQERQRQSGSAEPSAAQRHELLLARADAEVKVGIEAFRAAVDAGREALRAVLLINGAAAVALLGFLGAAISHNFPKSLGLGLVLPLQLLALGVLLAAVGYGARYMVQALGADGHVKTASGFNGFSIVCALGSYVSFGSAVYQLCKSLSQQFAA